MDGMEEDASTTRDGHRQDPHTLVSRQIDAQNLTSADIHTTTTDTDTNININTGINTDDINTPGINTASTSTNINVNTTNSTNSDSNMTTASSDRAVRLMQNRFEFSISPPTIARSDTDPFAFDAANFLWGDSSQQSQSLYESLCESQSQTQSQPMSQGFVHQVSGYTSRTNTNTISSSSNASWNTNLTSNLSNLTSSIIAGSGASSIDTISGGSSTGPGPGTGPSSSLGSGTGLGSAGNSPTRYNAHPNPNANPNAIIGAGHSRSAFSSRLPNISDGPTIGGGGGAGGGQIPAFSSLVVPQEHQEQQRRQQHQHQQHQHQQHQQQHQHQPQQASNYTAPPWQRGYSYGHPYSLPNVNARNINVNENAIRGQNITSRSTTGSSSSTLNHRMPPSYSPWEQQQQQQQQQSESIFSAESRDGNANVNAGSNANTNANKIAPPDKTEHLEQVLQKSGVQVTPDIKKKLPSWNQVDKLYGSKPQIIGLETCAAFQSTTTIPKDDAYIGAAGLFNTGTNLLSKLLQNHCSIPSRREKKSNAQYERRQPFRYRWTGMLFQVPWGKHNPISWRTHHVAQRGAEGVEQTHVLPVVILKDPFHWMSSMCRHAYAATWRHRPRHCPNLVASAGEETKKRGLAKDGKGRNLFKVIVWFQKTEKYSYTSLVDLYNRWYRDYLEIKDFPRLMIRYEDLLLYPEEIVTKVCHCGGGTVMNAMNGIHHDSSSSKPNHKGSNGLTEALIRYGSEDHRTDTMTNHDLEYANEELDSELMNLFHYTYADASAIQRGAGNTALMDAREEERERKKLLNYKNHDRKKRIEGGIPISGQVNSLSLTQN